MGATKLLTAAGGGITLDAASTATDKTITIPAVTGTMVLQETKITSGTSVASTSGTSITFNSIPSWVKRITVMMSGVSTNGSSAVQVQLGTSGGVQATGYNAASALGLAANTFTTSAITTGFGEASGAAALVRYGSAILSLLDSATGTWSMMYNIGTTDTQRVLLIYGTKALSGTLDRVRITTVNGTDTFDAGSINILYE
jgi:hypothetical protein